MNNIKIDIFISYAWLLDQSIFKRFIIWKTLWRVLYEYLFIFFFRLFVSAFNSTFGEFMQNWKSPWILKLHGNVLLSSLVASRLQLPASVWQLQLFTHCTGYSGFHVRKTRYDRAGRTPLADKKTVEKERETTQYDIPLHI